MTQRPSLLLFVYWIIGERRASRKERTDALRYSCGPDLFMDWRRMTVSSFEKNTRVLYSFC